MSPPALPNAPLVPTGWQTIGPFFPRTFFREGDNDLRRSAAARGEPIRILGRVLEAWQADAAGRFAHPHDPEAHLADPGFLGWGRAWTDAEGCYEFRTVLPGPYRDAAGPRAPHVNLSILASGIMARLSTVLFFPGFATANEADPVLRGIPDPALRALLVAAPAEPQEGQRAFRFDILLHGGDEETPFFAE